MLARLVAVVASKTAHDEEDEEEEDRLDEDLKTTTGRLKALNSQRVFPASAAPDAALLDLLSFFERYVDADADDVGIIGILVAIERIQKATVYFL
ncbi:unnamed protein product [Orchesella dallaii]|uniref:Uncharacterized protein n=1 Tax=Orchesella dallaii TaxID=48710 RepID=A0ABP1QSC3_9HEXA